MEEGRGPWPQDALLGGPDEDDFGDFERLDGGFGGLGEARRESIMGALPADILEPQVEDLMISEDLVTSEDDDAGHAARTDDPMRAVRGTAEAARAPLSPHPGTAAGTAGAPAGGSGGEGLKMGEGDDPFDLLEAAIEADKPK
jgi:hypothetical protein